MRPQHLVPALLLAGLTLAPVTAMQASVRECVAGRPTPQSYTWNFKTEATQLLQRFRWDALNLKRHAAVMESKTEDPTVDWRFDADQLNWIRSDIDDMGSAVCRLETIRRVLPPREQRVIDRAVPLAQSMAANADAAIVQLNRNQLDCWQPAYRTYAGNLYTDAGKISKAIGRFDKQVKS